MFNRAVIFFYFKVEEANSQREISSSHSHLWPTTITKYATGVFNNYIAYFLYKQNVAQQRGIELEILNT